MLLLLGRKFSIEKKVKLGMFLAGFFLSPLQAGTGPEQRKEAT